MNFEFVNGLPVGYIKNFSCLVIGDLHLGKELKFENKGITFVNINEKISKTLTDVFSKRKVKKIMILGDVKESIMYPDRNEYLLLKRFFESIQENKIEIFIAKGNHDGHLEEVFKQIKINVTINKEVFLGDFVFMHGNALPSQEAMLKKYLVVAHAHAVYNGESVWIKTGIGKNAKKAYKKINEKEKLILVPHFNPLLNGLELDKVGDFMPIFRNNIFSFENKKVFTLSSKEIKY